MVDRNVYAIDADPALISWIKSQLILFGVKSIDSLWDEDVQKTVSTFLLHDDNPLLFIYFQPKENTTPQVRDSADKKAASGKIKKNPFDGFHFEDYDMRVTLDASFSYIPHVTLYFLKEPGIEINSSNLTESIFSGVIRGNPLHSLLDVVKSNFAQQLLSQALKWPESIQKDFSSSLNKFLASLTEISYRVRGSTVLYVPIENITSVKEARQDKDLVQRLEATLIFWTSQIKEIIQQKDSSEHGENSRPLEEIEYWRSRTKDLMHLKQQLESSEVKLICDVLEGSGHMSNFKRLADDIQVGCQNAMNNLLYLSTLQEPCKILANAKPSEIPKIIPEILQMISMIWRMSKSYYSSDRITSLLRKVSNEIIFRCCETISLNDIFEGNVHSSMKSLAESIKAGEFWKSICIETFKNLAAHYEGQQFNRKFEYDANSVFAEIDAFVQRCNDLNEVCEAQIQFGAKGASENESGLPAFSGSKGPEITKSLLDIRQQFEKLVLELKNVNYPILDLSKSTKWHDDHGKFKNGIRDLELIMVNVLSSAFETVRSIEQGVQLLEAFSYLAKRDTIRRTVQVKASQLYEMFLNQLEDIQIQFENQKKNRPIQPHHPQYSGSALWAQSIRYRIQRDKALLDRAYFLPKTEKEQNDLDEKFYQVYESTLHKFQDEMYSKWERSIQSFIEEFDQLNIPIMRRVEGNLVNLNFSPELQYVFTECIYWSKVPGYEPPSKLIEAMGSLEDEDKLRINMENVILVVRDYNEIMLMMTDQQKRLFRERIHKLDKKISPAFTNLYWSSKGVIDYFVTECRKFCLEKKKEILEFNERVAEIEDQCKRIEETLLIKIDPKTVYHESSFDKEQSQHRTIIKKQLINGNEKIVEMMKALYDIFKSDIKFPEIEKEWWLFVQGIEKKVENALRTSLKLSLQKLNLVINEDKESQETQNPLFLVSVILDDDEEGNKRPSLKPSVSDLRDLVEKNQSELTRSTSVVTRLEPTLRQIIEEEERIEREANEDQELEEEQDEEVHQQKLNEINERRATEAKLRKKVKLPNYTDSIRKQKLFVELIVSTVQGMLGVGQDIETYLAKWTEEYSDIWNTNRENFLRRLALPKKRPASSFETEIEKYKLFHNSIQQEEQTHIIGYLQLDCAPLKHTLVMECISLQNALLDLLHKNAKTELEKIYKEFEDNSRSLSERPRDRETLAKKLELLSLMKTLVEKNINLPEEEQKSELEKKYEPIISYYQLLSHYDRALSDEEIENLKNLESEGANFVHVVRKSEKELMAHREEFKLKLQQELVDFEKKVENLKKEVDNRGPIRSDDTVEQAKSQINDIRQKLQSCLDDQVKLRDGVKLFDMQMKNYKQLKEIETSVGLMERIWNLQEKWNTTWDSWKFGIFSEINVSLMEKEAAGYISDLNRLAKDIRDWPIWQSLSESLDQFKRTLPLILDLKNEAMRDRHWDELRDIISEPFDEKSEDFNLQKIFALGFDSYAEDISTLSHSASQELSIERDLEKIKQTWYSTFLDVITYRDDHLKLSATDDIFQNLDDNQVSLGSMKISPYVVAFQTEVAYWEKTLSSISETIELILTVQTSWQYLLNIFEVEDIQKQLPEETGIFKVVNNKWRILMESITDSKNVIKSTQKEGLIDNLNDMNVKLEQIQKQLDDYLEKKRQEFPRFYFLSDGDLLEILGQSRDPNAVQKHLENCFEGIHRLKIEKQENKNGSFYVAKGMLSKKEEYVPFVHPVTLDGPVEKWLKYIEDAMRAAIKRLLSRCYQYSGVVDRDKWITEYQGQLLITASQLLWTKKITESLTKQQPKKALRALKKKWNTFLKQYSAKVRTKLPSLMRSKLIALLTIEVHSRDALEALYKSGCTSVEDFEWLKQLRFYWDEDKDNCVVRQTSAEIVYDNEYLGNTSRLVITPLTERCYMTLTTAVQLHKGGNPQGPAGTGKTETVKDLAKAIGKYCIVLNCSDGLDYLSMGRMFSGLCQTGAWSCFDEFNRIEIEVLSVVAQQMFKIISAIQAGLESFVFEGNQEILLNPTCGIFVTMNPGYAGRTELPDNLKALLRPISMMVPDSALICEIQLFSQGFEEPKPLAKKIATLYSLMSQQLSKQTHYDFGLRNIIGVLTAAGSLKREQEGAQVEEEVLLMTACSDMNLPKFVSQDVPLFKAIMNDLFPGLELPVKDLGVLQRTIEEILETDGYQKHPYIIERSIQLYETKKTRHGVMVVGESGSGKTTSWKTLQKAMTQLCEKGIEGFSKVETHVINPKAVSNEELYGEYNKSREWQHGILAVTMKQTCSDPSPNEKWILFDGPVDTLWIESMNTVLDDNKILTLISGERIVLNDKVSLLFEVQDLAVASPATVSRCGMVFFDPSSLGWEPQYDSWVSKRIKYEEKVESPNPSSVEKLLKTTLREFVSRALIVKNDCSTVLECNNFSLIRSLTNLFDSLAIAAHGVNPNDDEGNYLDMFQKYFIFSMIWSIGACVDEEGRKKLDMLFREFDTQFPSEDSVYEYHIDTKAKVWKSWEERVNKNWKPPTNKPFYKILVPTIDTTRNSFIIEALLKAEKHILVTGATGTGKTAIIDYVLDQLPELQYVINTINFSARTSSNKLQEVIEVDVEKKSFDTYAPYSGKQLVVFMDDFNMPQKDEFGSQPPLELIRQWIDYGFWYDRQKNTKKFLKKMQLVAAMGPPGGGRTHIPQRLQTRFNLINVTFPSNNQLKRIFGTLLEHRFKNLEEVKSLTENITRSTIEIYKLVTENLKPIPSKSHYIFNLRDMSKVFQGVFEADHESMDNTTQATRLWVHECFRVFHDRLVDNDDRTWFHNQISEKLSEIFQTKWSTLFKEQKKPNPFGRILKGTYQEMDNRAELMEILSMHLKNYNGQIGVQPMNLVLFNDAVEHLCRIARIITQPRGHACLIGVGGSGRQSLTKLAAFISEMELFSIEVTGNYQQREFHEDLQKVMLLSGEKRKDTVFLINDTQIVEESFLEDINTLLGSGEVPNLFDEEGIQNIYDSLKKDALEAGCNDIKAEIYKYFVDESKKHLHVVFCMSPVGDAFRSRIRMYPALVNCTTLDWFSEWPHDALQEVALHFIDDLKFEGEENVTELKKNISIIFDAIHSSVVEESARMLKEHKRINYVTPTNYLELVTGYKSLLEEKRTQIEDMKRKLEKGLSTLEKAREEVSVMSVELEKQKKEAAASKQECETLMLSILSQKSTADDKKQQVELDRSNIQIKKVKADKIREEAQTNLDEALPALIEAENALKDLDPKDISEIRAYAKPPKVVEETLCAVLVVLKKKPSFEEAKKVIANPKQFIESLLNYKKDQMSPKLLQKIGKITSKPDFTPERVGQVSLAAKGLCLWVIALEKYGHVYKEVKPKKDRLEEAERVLEANQKKLEQAESQLKELEITLDVLNQKYKEKVDENEKLRKIKELTESKLHRAEQLVGGLEGERVRWGESIEQYKKQLRSLAGDVLISAAFLSYSGPFDSEYRARLSQSWATQLRKYKIAQSSDFSYIKFLAKPTDVQLWNIQGLPSDDFSIENGALVTRGRRWPLMIDPQGQANAWIKNYEKGKLQVTDLMKDDLMRTLKNAIKFGQPVLIQDVSEEIDPALDPIIGKAVIHRGNSKILKLGEEELSWSDDFRLYITSKMANPRYTPEISTKTTIVNFAVTKTGLEEQLLGTVVKHERPELENQKTEIVTSVAQGKKVMEELEDEILKLLTAASNPLEDESLIQTLQKSKANAESISKQMQKSLQTEKKIDAARNQYRSAANRASILYFVLTDLARIDPMYQFSLDTYIELFENSILHSDKPPRQDLVHIRVELLNKYHTESVYHTTCQGLFEKDKLLFSFQMTIKLEQEKLGKDFNKDEYMFFLKGGQVLDKESQTPNPCPQWLPEEAWDNIYELDKLPSFHGIANSFEEVAVDWKEWYTSQEPENQNLPSEWQTKLSTYWERMIVVRAARSDRISIMVKEYIKDKMGEKYITPPVNDISQIFHGGSCYTPFIFVLSPGVDPAEGLQRFAEQHNMPLKSLSLGQGQDVAARNMISQARKDGEWVFLANCHLMIKWMPELEKIIETFLDPEQTPHPDFRLWLSSNPHPKFPITILQRSRKITTEPPEGLGSNIKRLYQPFEAEEFETRSTKPVYKRLLYSLAFFHSILLERRKFGTLGWNIPYDFNDSDFTISNDLLQLYLNRYEEIPWDALRFLIGEVNYGGRVSDENDRRVLNVYALQYFNELIATTQEYKLCDDKRYLIPKDGRLDVYTKSISQLPNYDPPVAFGQHPNADISSQISTSTSLLNNALSLSASSSVGSNQKPPEIIVMETAKDILENRLPEPIDTSVAVAAASNALTTVLIQESQRYNDLLSVIKTSLQDLILSIKGEVVMTEELDEVFRFLLEGKVPPLWKKVYPSMKLLASWIRDFSLRMQQLKDWSEGDPPAVFWLSGFTFPSGFLTALKQMAARAKNIAIDELQFEFVVMTPDQCHNRPKEGAYIRGLYLEGASWDHEAQCLCEPSPMELIVPMPIIWFKPVQNKKKISKEVYECPLYTYPFRAGDSFILNVELKTGDHTPDHYIKRGTGLLLSTSS